MQACNRLANIWNSWYHQLILLANSPNSMMWSWFYLARILASWSSQTHMTLAFLLTRWCNWNVKKVRYLSSLHELKLSSSYTNAINRIPTYDDEALRHDWNNNQGFKSLDLSFYLMRQMTCSFSLWKNIQDQQDTNHREERKRRGQRRKGEVNIGV